MGRVLRKHGYPVRLVAYHLVRPIGGTILSVMRGRLRKARYHWSIFVGRLDGWTPQWTPPIRNRLAARFYLLAYAAITPPVMSVSGAL